MSKYSPSDARAKAVTVVRKLVADSNPLVSAKHMTLIINAVAQALQDGVMDFASYHAGLADSLSAAPAAAKPETKHVVSERWVPEDRTRLLRKPGGGCIGRIEPKGAVSSAGRQKTLRLVQGQLEELHRELTALIKRMGLLRNEVEELRTNFAGLVHAV